MLRQTRNTTPRQKRGVLKEDAPDSVVSDQRTLKPQYSTEPHSAPEIAANDDSRVDYEFALARIEGRIARLLEIWWNNTNPDGPTADLESKPTKAAEYEAEQKEIIKLQRERINTQIAQATAELVQIQTSGRTDQQAIRRTRQLDNTLGVLRNQLLTVDYPDEIERATVSRLRELNTQIASKKARISALTTDQAGTHTKEIRRLTQSLHLLTDEKFRLEHPEAAHQNDITKLSGRISRAEVRVADLTKRATQDRSLKADLSRERRLLATMRQRFQSLTVDDESETPSQRAHQHKTKKQSPHNRLDKLRNDVLELEERVVEASMRKAEAEKEGSDFLSVYSKSVDEAAQRASAARQRLIKLEAQQSNKAERKESDQKTREKNRAANLKRREGRPGNLLQAPDFSARIVTELDALYEQYKQTLDAQRAQEQSQHATANGGQDTCARDAKPPAFKVTTAANAITPPPASQELDDRIGAANPEIEPTSALPKMTHGPAAMKVHKQRSGRRLESSATTASPSNLTQQVLVILEGKALRTAQPIRQTNLFIPNTGPLKSDSEQRDAAWEDYIRSRPISNPTHDL